MRNKVDPVDPVVLKRRYHEWLAEHGDEGTQFDFVQECKEAKIGEFCCYPLGEPIIKAFRISKEELDRYEHPIYSDCHWSLILEDIFVRRGIITPNEDRGILRDLHEKAI